MKPSVSSFSDYLSQITSKVQADEYMVVICTFAQGSYNGSLCPSTWMAAISEVCAANANVYDAKNITPNTVVGDVLGKVIVIVNCESAITGLTLPSDSKCFFTYMPLTLDKTTFTNKSYNTDLLYYGSKNSSEITFNNTHAQVSVADDETQTLPDNMDSRGYAPKLADRETKLQNILNWSSNNYSQSNYAHNAWIYLGLGGYCYYYDKGIWGIGASWKVDSNSYNTVATRFNTWIDDKVKAMDAGTTKYYPVGIVLMNKVTNYSTVLKDILLLNNKYRKAYDPNWEPKPSTGQSDVQSSAPDHSSGVVDNNENAVTPN